MEKKLTITVDQRVYEGLHKRIGSGRISRFIENLVPPHVLEEELERAYAQMGRDEQRETEALEWADMSQVERAVQVQLGLAAPT